MNANDESRNIKKVFFAEGLTLAVTIVFKMAKIRFVLSAKL